MGTSESRIMAGTKHSWARVSCFTNATAVDANDAKLLSVHKAFCCLYTKLEASSRRGTCETDAACMSWMTSYEQTVWDACLTRHGTDHSSNDHRLSVLSFHPLLSLLRFSLSNIGYPSQPKRPFRPHGLHDRLLTVTRIRLPILRRDITPHVPRVGPVYTPDSSYHHQQS
ncbi:hypothetical protein BDZ85DRAFT_74257 [Elsinoe ampelina]|uniref:Uncharacterized protein n=1 Tax=Elsinoe ampelina TaxID=302913 RepID=A0A6A6GJT6_9PEZI|nr:hypothetical protein BDZ85DRAFT_74257 [Elsinoe ampelina]